jgi:hypothetical protein
MIFLLLVCSPLFTLVTPYNRSILRILNQKQNEKHIKKIALFVLGAAFLAACQEEEVKGPEAPAPNVTLLEESLHPEGIIYSAEQQKYLQDHTTREKLFLLT